MQHDNDNGGLTFISMFSGIEAASVAFGPLGWRCLAVSEIDKSASRVLAHHYPDVPNLGDMSRVDWSQYCGKVDIVCGGPPCQAFSVAGLRDGLTDARGNLSLVYMRALHAIKPRNAIIENVPGWLTMADNAFGCFLAGLVGADGPFIPIERKPRDGKSSRWWRWAAKEKRHAPRWPKCGMVNGPKGRAAWHLKDAQYFGLAQRRERVLVVADFGNGADPSEVLFERVSVPWNPPARGEAGEGVAGTISARTKGGGGLGTDFDLDGGLRVHAIQAGALRANPDSGPDGVGAQESIAYTLEARAEVQAICYAPEIARCDATREGSSQDYETTTMVAQAVCVTGAVTHTLTTEGADASEDGTGRGTPIVWSLMPQNSGKDFKARLAPTLRAGGHKDSHQNGGVGPAVAFQTSQSGVRVSDIHATLDSNNGPRRHNGALVGSAVRRLTPRECERLQGFPDDYTRIPVKWYPTKKVTRTRPDDMWEPDPLQGWWLMQADGPRYKQLGNSWAVPKFTWLGRRIQEAMPANDNKDHAIAA